MATVMERPEAQTPLDEINYFVCTLGQARPFSPKTPHTFTVNDFLDEQHIRVPDLPAAAFPKPQEAGEWTAQMLSKCPDQIYSLACSIGRSLLGVFMSFVVNVDESLYDRTIISHKLSPRFSPYLSIYLCLMPLYCPLHTETENF